MKWTITMCYSCGTVPGNRYHIRRLGGPITRHHLLTLWFMADGSDTTLTTDRTLATKAPDGLVGGIQSFAAQHGGAKAVIEYVGKRGARIVLVGEDGEWGDQFADGTDVARAACAEAGVEVQKEWERELMDQMRPSTDLWRSMSRRALSR